MSVRVRYRKDGSPYSQVRFRVAGVESSVSFDDHAEALKFEGLVHQVGAQKALDISKIVNAPERSMTVGAFLTHHIDHLTGVEQRTLDDYRSYLRKDIAPVLGSIPLTALGEDDIARWVQHLASEGASAKTIQNKHGFLSGALAKAVPKYIAGNPAAGRRLPRGDGDDHEMVFLTQPQFAHVLNEVTEAWQPMVRFLVASGCRISEATAVKPGDVDVDQSTVNIVRAWKRSSKGYHIGPPKTKRSKRTIDVPGEVLEQLDYTGEWLFTNPGRGRRSIGGPVRPVNFRANVWWPAVERAWPSRDGSGQVIEDAMKPRVHDLRHTCASWLIQAGVPLPVISRHLGHESIQVTVDTYGHLDRTSTRAAAAVMKSALSF